LFDEVGEFFDLSLGARPHFFFAGADLFGAPEQVDESVCLFFGEQLAFDSIADDVIEWDRVV
jgi:hypothetical protein